MASGKEKKNRAEWESPESVEGAEIDLMELFYRLLENAKYIIAGAVSLAVLVGVYTAMFVAPTYEATAKLYVMNPKDSAINLSDLQIGSYLASDYIEVFSTWEVHEMVLQNLGLNYSYEEIERMLSVRNPSNTRILYITVRNTDPAEAALIANEYAAVAKKFISDTMATEEPSVMSYALTPTVKVSPKLKLNLIASFLIGALIVCVVIFIQLVLDDKIKTAEDIRKYADLPTLAIIPIMNARAMPSKRGRRTKSGRRG